MKPYVPSLLSFNGGFVDTAGFLALHGLFTAHVTGNFVTLGAAIALGTSGILAKLLALPTFCVVVMLARIVGGKLPGARSRSPQNSIARQGGIACGGRRTGDCVGTVCGR